MSKTVIIGGGPAGLTTAINIAKKNKEVIIIERNKTLGKKLLMTGNGKCNYYNEDQDLIHYHSQNPELVKEIITKENQTKVLSFFDSLGIIPRIKNGYYYPYSNQAVSIQYSLLKQAEILGVKIITEQLVKNITLKNNEFIIELTNDFIKADKLVLATGSKATSKTGSDGLGYQLASYFNHTIIKPLPALVSLKGHEKYFKEWAGIRTEVCLKHLNTKENGEIQLTDYGISGIPVFNLSGEIAKRLDKNEQVTVTIDFLPIIETKHFLEFMEKRNKLLPKRSLNELFDSLLNYKLVRVLLHTLKIKSPTWDDLTTQEKDALVTTFKEFPLTITEANSFDKAQVCSGGVPLTEINTKTMESLKVKNLYLVGELLDVDGACGGYNLSFAWISAITAGQAIGEELD